MLSKDVSGIMTKGTPKQRVTLLFSNYALEQFEKEGFLTESEIRKIMDSFKTPQELALYNKFVAVDGTVRNSIHYLNQIRLGYREQIAYITGYAMLWDSALNTAELLNSILYEVKDKKLKTKLTKTIETQGRWVFTKFIADKEGYINLQTRKKDVPITDYENLTDGAGIETLIDGHKRNAEAFLVKGKTFLKALYDYMDENGFNIKEYKDYIKGIETDLQEDKSFNPKHSKKSFKQVLGEAYSEKIDSNIFGKYFVFPDYEATEIDEAQYKEFRGGYLK